VRGFWGAFAGILALVIFVTVHELGHFVAAKATGIKATQFFFGFGPRLWSFKRGETEYGVKALPLGGYVRIIGMNPMEEVAPEDEARAYRNKPFWVKSVVVLAGVGTNFLLAFILFFGLVVASGVNEPTTQIGTVVEELPSGEPTPASAAGLEPGDALVSIAGVPIEQWEDVGTAVSSRADEVVVIVVERDGQEVQLDALLAKRTDEATGQTVGFLGITPETINRPVAIGEAFGVSGRFFGLAVGDTFDAVATLVRPETISRLAGVFMGNTDVPNEQRPVSVIGIGQIGAQVDQIGLAAFIFLLASINVMLGCLNILPLYPLDGGHFAVALFEKVTRRRVDIRYLAPVAAAVIAFFVFLGLAAVILDLTNPIRL
jgi:membrane-associated protease RseP (regulator of RpoE activity)